MHWRNPSKQILKLCLHTNIRGSIFLEFFVKLEVQSYYSASAGSRQKQKTSGKYAQKPTNIFLYVADVVLQRIDNSLSVPRPRGDHCGNLTWHL